MQVRRDRGSPDRPQRGNSSHLRWAGYLQASTEQERQTARRTEDSEPTASPAGSTGITEKGKKLQEDMDRLIEEIDEVLEENAEDFVKNYVQRGGE